MNPAPAPIMLTVNYRLNPVSGAWSATIEQVPSVVTHGTTLKEAYDRVRAALAIVRPDLNHVVLESHVVIQ